jgi:hypothetical protein
VTPVPKNQRERLTGSSITPYRPSEARAESDKNLRMNLSVSSLFLELALIFIPGFI